MKPSIQEQLAKEIQERFPDAQVKKINKDNFLDIHLPSIHDKKATHLFFNTVKGNIKTGFYCRDEEFLSKLAPDLEHIEFYAQGVRLAGNPVCDTVEDAIENAEALLRSISEKIQIANNKAVSSNSITDNAQKSMPNDAASLVKCVTMLGYYFCSMDKSAAFRDQFEEAIIELFQPTNFSNTENEIVKEVMEHLQNQSFLSKCYRQGRQAAEEESQNYEYVRDFIESLHLYIKDLDYYVNDPIFLKKYLETFIEIGNILPSKTPADKEIRVQDRYLVVHIALTNWTIIDKDEFKIEKTLDKVKYNLPYGNLLKYRPKAENLTSIEKASLFIYNLILLSEDGLEIKKTDIYRAKMLISDFFGFEIKVQDLEIKGSLTNSNEDDLGKIIGGFGNNFCFEVMHFFNCQYNIEGFRNWCMDLFVESYEQINDEFDAYIEDSIDEADFDAEELREEKIMDQFYDIIHAEDDEDE
jgi:hypothetical protein